MAELVMDAEWYRRLVDAMSDAIHVVDRDLVILVINQSFQRWLKQLGLERDVVGLSVLEAFPFLPRQVVAEYEEVFRTGKPVTSDEENTLGGEVIYTQTHKIPIAEHSGEATRVLTVITDVTLWKQAEEELRWLAADKAALAHAVLAGQERERRRLARDLHDGVGQIVAVMKMEAEYLASHAHDADEVSRVAARLTERAEGTLNAIRNMSYSLRPPVLDDLGIGCALSTLARDMSESTIDCVAIIDEELPTLPDALSTGLYRMAQEALSNVLRHADARHCRVSLRCQPGWILLEIEDDGRGINEREVHAKASGLSNLRERATLLGGRVTITGGSDGTRVSVSVPFDP